MDISKIMHPRIAELARELLPLVDNAPAAPTEYDRNDLSAVREKIKRVSEEPGIELSTKDDSDRAYLYVESTRLANRQEDFWENNGRKWALKPYCELTDEQAKAAIQTCIRRNLRSGFLLSDIHEALKQTVGVVGVAIDISPAPVNGRLPEIGRTERFQFQFMAHGPSGETIR